MPSDRARGGGAGGGGGGGGGPGGGGAARRGGGGAPDGGAGRQGGGGGGAGRGRTEPGVPPAAGAIVAREDYAFCKDTCIFSDPGGSPAPTRPSSVPAANRFW